MERMSNAFQSRSREKKITDEPLGHDLELIVPLGGQPFGPKGPAFTTMRITTFDPPTKDLRIIDNQARDNNARTPKARAVPPNSCTTAVSTGFWFINIPPVIGPLHVEPLNFCAKFMSVTLLEENYGKN
jgi:hypothetical protein